MSRTRLLNHYAFILGMVLAVLAMGAPSAHAFSPYENYLLSEQDTHVGLIAQAKPGKEAELEKALTDLNEKKQVKKLKKAGITELSSFSKEIQGKRWYVVDFTFDGKSDYLSAAEAFENASEETKELGKLIVSHPRADRDGTQWAQMEWINFIRGKVSDEPVQQKIMIVTRIKPKKEAEYRSLHQTVWPGVRDALVRGNKRNLNIWLIEIGDDLVEFLYLEYVGEDSAADDAKDKADSVNIRWWSNTDPCQIGLPGNENWVLMDSVSEKTEEQ